MARALLPPPLASSAVAPSVAFGARLRSGAALASHSARGGRRTGRRESEPDTTAAPHPGALAPAVVASLLAASLAGGFAPGCVARLLAGWAQAHRPPPSPAAVGSWPRRFRLRAFAHRGKARKAIKGKDHKEQAGALARPRRRWGYPLPPPLSPRFGWDPAPRKKGRMGFPCGAPIRSAAVVGEPAKAKDQPRYRAATVCSRGRRALGMRHCAASVKALRCAPPAGAARDKAARP